MSGSSYLADVRHAAQASVRFFSSKNKAFRERWVVRSFLKNLDIRFSNAQVRSAVSEPPDVTYKGAAFEVKELLDLSRKRHAEYKAHAKLAHRAKDASELLEHYTPEDSTLDELVMAVTTDATHRAGTYAPAVRAGLDLLYYVNYKNLHSVSLQTEPTLEPLERLGFRSVSILQQLSGFVLVASDRAPPFLKMHAGRWRSNGGEHW